MLNLQLVSMPLTDKTLEEEEGLKIYIKKTKKKKTPLL
jgi:hypothetical protein